MSQISWCGIQKSECGYCHSNKETSIKHGFTSNLIYADDYDLLMNSGWRRSGSFFYKPVMHQSCCPSYTIRLKADIFSPKRDQKQVKTRFERYLKTGSIRVNTQTINNSNISENTSSNIHQLTIDTTFSNFTQEKYDLYKKYQMSVHKEDENKITIDGFKHFLVDSPLRPRPKIKTNNNSNNIQQKRRFPTGSYHQSYRIDNKLVAVGVIDIVSSGISSVYCFYDNDMKELELGKLCTMKEIEFTIEQGLEYYYLGYYISNCQKMKYKSDYRPCELLCPVTLQYYPFDYCNQLLCQYKFTPFHPILYQERASISSPDSISETIFTSTNNSISNEFDYKKLDKFTPNSLLYKNYPNINTNNNTDLTNNFNSIPLEIRPNEIVFKNELTSKGNVIVTNILNEFVSCCGYTIDYTKLKFILH